jgi:ABC-type nitrate/sulfonate/bicarbonate transport system, ATPase component
MNAPHNPLPGRLRISKVSKLYDPRGARVLAVDNCSMDIEPGEFCVIVGPSGCGKTTLLNAIAGFHGISSGEIHLDGELLCSPEQEAVPGPDRVVVFQNGALFPWATVLENVIYGPKAQNLGSDAELAEKARSLLARLGLNKIENSYPGEISSGMRRRVEIARAMIMSPSVLLLDEPFRALDALTKLMVHQFLLDVYDAMPRTVFFITHDLDEAIFLGSRVHIMTTRPGRFKKTLTVDLPRPRSFRDTASPEFMRLKQECDEAVHEEAVKAFEAGEREMS